MNIDYDFGIVELSPDELADMDNSESSTFRMVDDLSDELDRTIAVFDSDGVQVGTYNCDDGYMPA